MKRTRYAEEQIIKILKEYEAGAWPAAWGGREHHLPLEVAVRWHGGQ